jgi:hypothetical protein
MTEVNPFDPYSNESRYIHSEEWRRKEEELGRRRAGAHDEVGGPSARPPSASVGSSDPRPASRKRMALDTKVCLAVGIVCVIILALMAHW